MNKGNIQTVLIIIGVIAITGLIIWGMSAADQSKNVKYKSMTSREVAATCTTDMATQFHIHPNLSIVIDGVKQKIPADIGITNGCMHPLHTHDTTGRLHVESPVQKDFTLGDFFFVWDKPFDATHLMDKTGKVTMTVNDKPVDTFENTILTDGANIEIQYQ